MYPEKQSFFVLGLSRSGKSAAQFLLSRGGTVYIYDDITSERVEKTAKELEEMNTITADRLAALMREAETIVEGWKKTA